MQSCVESSAEINLITVFYRWWNWRGVTSQSPIPRNCQKEKWTETCGPFIFSASGGCLSWPFLGIVWWDMTTTTAANATAISAVHWMRRWRCGRHARQARNHSSSCPSCGRDRRFQAVWDSCVMKPWNEVKRVGPSGHEAFDLIGIRIHLIKRTVTGVMNGSFSCSHERVEKTRKCLQMCAMPN